MTGILKRKASRVVKTVTINPEPQVQYFTTYKPPITINDKILHRNNYRKPATSMIRLINVWYVNNQLMGKLAVKNLSYDKQLYIKLTNNDWQTYDIYHDGFRYLNKYHNDDNYDEFIFQFDINLCGNVEFVINYTTDHQQYWDNNYGFNYQLSIHPGDELVQPAYFIEELKGLGSLHHDRHDDHHDDHETTGDFTTDFTQDFITNYTTDYTTDYTEIDTDLDAFKFATPKFSSAKYNLDLQISVEMPQFELPQFDITPMIIPQICT